MAVVRTHSRKATARKQLVRTSRVNRDELRGTASSHLLPSARVLVEAAGALGIA